MARHPDELLRISTTQAIVEHLKERIVAGELAPGALLPSERELQQKFKVSRLAVREGLARLSALGIIRVKHGRGAFVTENASTAAIRDALMPLLPRSNAARLRDMLQARALIEGEQAAEAARRRTNKDLLRLGKILRPPKEILKDSAACADLDFKFHETVAHIAGNVFLTVMWEALAFHIRCFLIDFAKDAQARLDALDRHRPLVEAITARNADEARRLARTHLDACREHYELQMRLPREARGDGNSGGNRRSGIAEADGDGSRPRVRKGGP